MRTGIKSGTAERDGAGDGSGPAGADAVRPGTEAKDATRSDRPAWDVGANLGNRRVAYIGALGLVFAIAAVLVLSVALANQVLRNRYVVVRAQRDNNRIMQVSGDFTLADSVLYRPNELIETAKDYLDLRYGYDFRAGVTQILAALTYVRKENVQGAVGTLDRELLARMDAAQTQVDLAYDSTRVQYLSKGVFRVTIVGKRRLRNLQYSGTVGAKETPFREDVFLEAVEAGPKFPHGVAVRGAKGDLEP